MAREYRYRDFDVLVQSRELGYSVRVLDSPAGQTASVPSVLPFEEKDLQIFLLEVGHARSAPVRGPRADKAPLAREFGSSLFDALFVGEVRDRLTASLQTTTAAGEGLRLRLRLADCPELADVPWEFLYDAQRRRFLVLSEWTPVVRYLELPGAVRPLEVAWPLRMLVMISSPTDYEELDTEAEWANLQQSLSHLVAERKVVLERVPPTLSALRRRLRRLDWHVLHFVGHGGFDERAGDGVIVLETPERRGAPVTGQDLGQMLCDHRALRLVVLNACEGGRGDRRDPFAGTAQSLILQGVPAVVAMQFEITDAAAITFAEELYEAVADGCPLDAAVAEARAAVFAARSSSVEWATPVLYLRSPDGRVFDLTDTPAPVSNQPAPTPAEQVRATALPPTTPLPVDEEPVVLKTSAPDAPAPQPNRSPEAPVPPPAPARPQTSGPLIAAALLVVATVVIAAAAVVVLMGREPAPAPSEDSDGVPAAADNEDQEQAGSPPDEPVVVDRPSPATDGDAVAPTLLEAVAVTASTTAAPGADAAGRAVSYEAQNLVDGDLRTAWRAPGAGVGEVILVELDEPSSVQRVGLVPGYSKIDADDGTDRFRQNRIVTSVEYHFDDGSSVRATFTHTPTLQFTDVDVMTRTVTVEITSTTPPGGRDFTPISEIQVYGFSG